MWERDAPERFVASIPYSKDRSWKEESVRKGRRHQERKLSEHASHSLPGPELAMGLVPACFIPNKHRNVRASERIPIAGVSTPLTLHCYPVVSKYSQRKTISSVFLEGNVFFGLWRTETLPNFGDGCSLNHFIQRQSCDLEWKLGGH